LNRFIELNDGSSDAQAARMLKVCAGQPDCQGEISFHKVIRLFFSNLAQSFITEINNKLHQQGGKNGF